MFDTILANLRHWDMRLVVDAAHLASVHPWFNWVVYFCAEILVYTLPLLLFYLWEQPHIVAKYHGSRKAVLMAVMAVVLALSIKTAISTVYFRDRPFISYPELITLKAWLVDSSFPSAHTLFGFAIAGSLLFSGYKKIAWVALGIAFLIALGRVFSGVHYPSDVIAGMLIGLGCAWYLHREASSLKRYLPDH